MVLRTYISKINTIIKDSSINNGLSPISELCFGLHNTRMLIYFDHSQIKEMVDKGYFPNKEKLHHILHITNCGSIDFTQVHGRYPSSIGDGFKKRATSFDVIFFKIPQEWDRGKGFDYSKNYLNQDYYDSKITHNRSRLISSDGSNWYKAKNGHNWINGDGIYSREFLSKEYDKFSSEEGSNIIIGRQHFDIGNENVKLDITELFNSYIYDDEPNYGICMAFTPDFENTDDKNSFSSVSKMEKVSENYVGFFTDKTNTFFEPYVETIYDDVISDDRGNFVLDKKNKLYLYCTIGGQLRDLDKLPNCTVRDDEGYEESFEVKKATVGVYYIEITLPHTHFKGGTMLYDTWDGITYQGQDLKPLELDFTTVEPEGYFQIGKSIQDEPTFTPQVYGIQSQERILRGDKRKFVCIARETYNSNSQKHLIDNIYFRLYVMDGEREIDVINWEQMNKTVDENFVTIDTNMLIPQKYYIDIKINYGMESIIHHDIVHFDIVNSLDNKYK